LARTYTRAELRTKVRERADLVGNNFVTDTELNGYIDASYADLYDILIESGLNYFRITGTVNSVAGTASYALPSDFYGTVALDYQVNTNQYVKVPEIEFADRLSFPTTGTRGLGYEIVGSNLILYPAPSATGQVYKHLYIPSPAKLAADGDTVDGVSGWEEYIVVDCAIKCKEKEEADASQLERERARLLERITAASQNRQWANTRRVIDVDTAGAFDEMTFDPANWRYR
jgi:hypothetical protein